MILFRNIVVCLAAVLAAQSAQACSIIVPTAAEERKWNDQARRSSKAVGQDRQCRFLNAGIHDSYSAGPAIRLENQRVYQVLEATNGEPNDILLTDCSRREVVRVRSNIMPQEDPIFDSCGDTHGEVFPILQPVGQFSLEEGSEFSDLVNLIRSSEVATVDEELSFLLKDNLGRAVPQKDRVDLLCGCKIFHPQSAGASQ